MRYWKEEISEASIVKLLCCDHEIGDFSNIPDSIRMSGHRYQVHQNGNYIGYVPDEIVHRLVKEGKIEQPHLVKWSGADG